MIEYIIPGNIDDRILAKAVHILKSGGTAAIPTDTSWSIVCSFNSREGIKRLKSISKERDERYFTLLCSDISQFGELCSLDNSRFRLIKRLTPGPYVFILKTLPGTEKSLGLRRREIGVRLPDSPVPQALIQALECPLYGITAKRTMLAGWIDDDAPEQNDNNDAEDNAPSNFTAFYREETMFDGGWEMEDIRGLDLIIDPGEDQNRLFTTVLDISGDEIQLLRQGKGDWTV